jgi:CheY-like chemotaxis protein
MSESNTERRTILVVEDIEDTRFILRMWLEERGYQVLEAVNGQEAVEVAGHIYLDLILMDLSLPLLDGFAATHYIRKQVGRGSVPIVAISAYAGAQMRADALAAGCNEFISKPFNWPELERVLGQLLGNTERE